MKKVIFTSAVFVLFLFRNVAAQQQAPQTPASFLAEHHVEDSPQGLQAALSNTDAAVRGTAAGLLAQKMGRKSIPFLEAALVHESRIDIQVALAGSLNELGDNTGHNWLVNRCRQLNAQPLDRMLAAIKLLDGHSNECVGQVIDILGRKPDHDTTSQGLQYLRRANALPANYREELKTKLEVELSSSAPNDRWNASRILAVIGDSSSIAPMQKAIHEETDAGYRQRLQDNLRALRVRLQLPPT
jgi:hypothetical protein